ncbi:hypothetical protein C806_01842 [Lachnospiraceae bacterium 3-1]|nr:hypothetical protein C806_01842 [Lachnospiraceae bacterium 3-1]
MSQIEIKEENGRLTIYNHRKRKNELDMEEIDLSELIQNKVYGSYVKATKDEDSSRVLYFEPYEEDLETGEVQSGDEQEEKQAEIDPEADIFPKDEREYILVYSVNKKIKYTKGAPEIILKRLLPFKIKILSLRMNKRRLSICMVGYFINAYSNLQIGTQNVCADNVCSKCEFPITDQKTNIIKMIMRGAIQKIKMGMDEIVDSVSTIDKNISAEIEVNGIKIPYGLPKRKWRVKVSKKYFAPIAKIIRDGFMIFVRRNARGNIVLVTRMADEYETTGKYRFWESKIVSRFLYYCGKIVSNFSKKQVNLYFEKETMKAEEGTYEVFSLASENQTSDNYFIIDPKSEDYERICQDKNVVLKYSPKYYWLVYRANNVITTEAPAHLNILRSGNKYIRFRMIELKFVFLQHGVTYMKCHGPTSAFVAGREAEPEYIFVGSEKERDVVVDMLRIPEERVLITGLPIFSTIPYKHITAESEDFVTIMLTFKPYEERLDNFEKSRYYHAIIELYDILKNYVPEEKILIVAHPRIQYLLETTSLKERMWNRPISQVLEITKLMITDYSSVAYNSFYQGAAVLFYQEDIEEYEEVCGNLIPRDEEYIGLRAFDLQEFEDILGQIIQNQKIVLDVARTKEHEENYNSINEFHDGKNVERIYEKLAELKLV